MLEQLIAESLGKNGVGLVPVIALDGEHHGSSCAHLAIGLLPDDLPKKAVEAPIFQIVIDDKYQIGALMHRIQLAVAFSAAAFKINLFDQPDVVPSKAGIQSKWQYAWIAAFAG